MTAPKREYSRLYHDLVDDPMFEKVYADDALFGAWAKLLMLADSSWPASAPIPVDIGRSRIARLVECGLVELVGARFRIRGMDKERGGRSDHGRRGADGRWHGPEQSPQDAGEDDDGMPDGPASIPRASGEHPPSNADGMPSKDEQSRAKQRRAEQEQTRALSDSERIGDAMREASGLHFPMPSRNGDRLELMAKRVGVDRVLETIRQATDDIGVYPDQANLVNRVADYLNAAPKPTTPDPEAERERARIARSFEATARREAEFTKPPEVSEDIARQALAASRAALGRTA